MTDTLGVLLECIDCAPLPKADGTAPADSRGTDDEARDPLAAPTEIHARDAQARGFASVLPGADADSLPPTVAIDGPPGTGKPLPTRRGCRKVMARQDTVAVEYVNLTGIWAALADYLAWTVLLSMNSTTSSTTRPTSQATCSPNCSAASGKRDHGIDPSVWLLHTEFSRTAVREYRH